MPRTFPCYIQRNDKQWRIWTPPLDQDLPHVEFWKRWLAPRLARHLGIPAARLADIPYAMRRARIVPARKHVYYGEEPDPTILGAIEARTGLTGLRFVHDDHECRIADDVRRLCELLGRSPEGLV